MPRRREKSSGSTFLKQPGPSTSQPGPSTNDLSQSQEIIDKVNDLVRFLVFNAGHNPYVRRADIVELLKTKSVKEFQKIIDDATTILKNVYGYNLLVCDQAENGTKAYLISNALPYVNYNPDPEDKSDPDKNKICLLIILSHIYMSNTPVSESNLYQFLKEFGITVEKRHKIFGNVKDYIKSLVKQKYLAQQTDPVSKKVLFSWGIRSEMEISKHDVLKFVCKVYGDRKPESFANQYQAAEQQGFENKRLLDAETMDE